MNEKGERGERAWERGWLKITVRSPRRVDVMRSLCGVMMARVFFMAIYGTMSLRVTGSASLYESLMRGGDEQRHRNTCKPQTRVK